ncbi:hypothetical protein [Clostridium sp. D53t1_180928_C8]|uniref:hypothetical protein n=1 Tax=Clostridium sp. D53t1_180928_C8 TaxID=2787101 RepID=UPI0018AAD968|nr:hypothetical protein [Clostridium sp. D53t1_180928_C8]
MYDKGSLKKDIKLTYLDLKNLKKYYFLPIIIIFILIPILLTLKYFAVRDMVILKIDMINYTELFSAISSIWWIIMISRQYIEVDGNEILYVYKKMRCIQVILLFVWYIFNISILFLGYSLFFENIIYEYIIILMQSVFFISISYMLIYVFKSVSISIMIILTYIISFSIFFKYNISYLNIFTVEEITMSEIILNKCMIILPISILSFLIGTYKNYKYLS